jgi:hypothetical protein
MSKDIDRMGLQPVAESQLEGRSNGRRGKELTVTDSSGAVVVLAVVGKAEADFRTAGGRWRIEESKSGVAVLNWKHEVVATARKGEVSLSSGERLL